MSKLLAAPSAFDALTPDLIIGAAEAATGLKLTGLTSPLPSYINRVYELMAVDESRIIIKFYRPGRWSTKAILQEHQFIKDCAEAEIPVVAPLPLVDGATLSEAEGIRFAVYPKKWGRAFEINEEEDWLRLGRLIARMHVAGAGRTADARVHLHPKKSLQNDIDHLIQGKYVPHRFQDPLREIGEKLTVFWENHGAEVETIRLHGDCHRGNMINRPGEGLMLIDFDDMMIGPPVQDIWMLLPGHAADSRREIDLLLQGYETFRNFDRRTLKLIEIVRTMRIIYYLAWCSRQSEDFQFRRNFPNWGSDGFWQQEIADLGRQMQIAMGHIN